MYIRNPGAQQCLLPKTMFAAKELQTFLIKLPIVYLVKMPFPLKVIYGFKNKIILQNKTRQYNLSIEFTLLSEGNDQIPLCDWTILGTVMKQNLK